MRRGWMMVAGAAFVGAVLWAERARPLRRGSRPGSSDGRRLAANTVMGLASMAVVSALERPAAMRAAVRVERERLGIVQGLGWPAWARDLLAVVLADWSIYWWHVATHREPLWRLHVVHHTDLALDASTALRFHAADMALGVPFRMAQVRVIGMSPRAFGWWQGWFFASVLFHHSNARLPARLERVLSAVITTPRMHGIHHMASREAGDSNWSSGLALWDHLHGSFRGETSPDELPQGLPGYRRALRVGDLAALPFRPQLDAWEPGHGGTA